MSPILTIEQAKNAIGLKAVQAPTADDLAWLDACREALGSILEQHTAPIERRQEIVLIRGGFSSLALPWPVVTVDTVTSATLTTWTVAAASLRAGLLRRTDTGLWPDEEITVTVTVGYFVPGADPDVDAPVVPLKPSTYLAACELMRFLWQQGRQGPGFAGIGQPGVAPQGFLVPARVKELLRSPDAPRALPGLA